LDRKIGQEAMRVKFETIEIRSYVSNFQPVVVFHSTGEKQVSASFRNFPQIPLHVDRLNIRPADGSNIDDEVGFKVSSQGSCTRPKDRAAIEVFVPPKDLSFILG
jgi:hypothetical protein